VLHDDFLLFGSTKENLNRSSEDMALRVASFRPAANGHDSNAWTHQQPRHAA